MPARKRHFIFRETSINRKNALIIKINSETQQLRVYYQEAHVLVRGPNEVAIDTPTDMIFRKGALPKWHCFHFQADFVCHLVVLPLLAPTCLICGRRTLITLTETSCYVRALFISEQIASKVNSQQGEIIVRWRLPPPVARATRSFAKLICHNF
jgi:hypothetical protein